MTNGRKTTDNTGPKVAFQWLKQVPISYRDFCLVDSETSGLLNRNLLVAAKMLSLSVKPRTSSKKQQK